MSQFVKSIFTENTGGGCMVDFLELHTGQVVGLSDESIVLYPSQTSFYEGDENGNFNEFPVIRRIPNKPALAERPALGIYLVSVQNEYTVDLYTLDTGEVLGIDGESICLYANMDKVFGASPDSVLASISLPRPDPNVSASPSL